MVALPVLLLADDRPGHYHLAEGVVAALARLGPVRPERLTLRRRRWLPARLLRPLAARAPAAVLRLGYGLDAAHLPPARLVVSAGGETLAANVAAADALGADNIFCGSLRGVGPERFSLVITSYARHAGRPNHLVALKPSAIDPDALGRPKSVPRYGPDHPPALAGLLIGGDSGLFKYAPEEWARLLDFTRAVSRAWGTRWLVSTSPRTGPDVSALVFELAKDKSVVADFVDFRWAGPGTLERIFARADVVVCSEDSSTMISEAVAARLPVLGVSPAVHAFKPEEAEYRAFLAANGWCRFLPIADLTVARFGAALTGIAPPADNPLDRLAVQLRDRLPWLFAPAL